MTTSLPADLSVVRLCRLCAGAAGARPASRSAQQTAAGAASPLEGLRAGPTATGIAHAPATRCPLPWNALGSAPLGRALARAPVLRAPCGRAPTACRPRRAVRGGCGWTARPLPDNPSRPGGAALGSGCSRGSPGLLKKGGRRAGKLGASPGRDRLNRS